MNLNVENWKEFKIKDIFRLEPTKGLDSTELLEGNDINYIGAKHEDNGLMMRCQLEGFESWVSKGNCIVFIQLGAGSAGYVNYIPDYFIGMNGKTLCGYIDGIMNPKIGLFLETILCKERPKYSFGRSWTGDRLKETTIKLPVDSQGCPDWKFMEDYITSINHKPITTKNRGGYESPTLGTTNWQEYKIKDLFDIKAGLYHYPEEYTDGKTPYISASNTNNGIAQNISLEPDFNGNCIVTGKVGCTAFYQPQNFCATSDVNIFIPKNFALNKYISLFLVTIINKSENYKWSYGRQCRVGDCKEIIIKLPTKNNKPDWEFMENYIKSLPYGDRI